MYRVRSQSILVLVVAFLGGVWTPLSRAETSENIALARSYFREVEALCSADGGQLWGVSLQGPLLFVEPATRAVLANQADAEGHLQPEGDIFVGSLPPNVPVANTSLKWAGTDWVMLLWPPPSNEVERHVLLMHESWHRVQVGCGLPASNPQNQHLNTFEGRFWLQLEWRALEVTLRATGDDRRAALEDALLFRRERQRLFDSATAQECALEASEGLAEYTGIRLSGMTTDEQLAYAATQLQQRPAQFSTFNRSFAYLTGPAYALLLDTTDQPWRTGLAASVDLSRRLEELLNMKLPAANPDDLARRAERYDGSALRKTEVDREENRKTRHAAMRKQYVEGAVLVFPLKTMQMTFDPRNVETVGDLGTYYPTLTLGDQWGRLVVTQGALMSNDFKSVRVVAPTDPQARELSGPGWKLELDPGWQLVGDDRAGSFRVAPRTEKGS